LLDSSGGRHLRSCSSTLPGSLEPSVSPSRRRCGCSGCPPPPRPGRGARRRG
jgi:hypothetical protein